MTTNTDFDDIFNSVGAQYGIHPDWLKAVSSYESGLDPSFKNPDSSASGLAAMTDAAAKDYGVDRTDPRSSIDGMARYLRDNFQKCKDDPDPEACALSMYKTGPNSASYDANYVKGIRDTFNNLQKNRSATSNFMPVPSQQPDPSKAGLTAKEQAFANIDAYDPSKADMSSNASSTQSATPLSPREQAFANIDAYDPSKEKTPSSQPSDLEYENGAPHITVRPTGQPLQQHLSISQVGELARTDPAALAAYRQAEASRIGGELEQGAGDVVRSPGKLAATYAPSAFNAVVNTVDPGYAQQDNGNASQKYLNDLQNRNEQFQQQYGQDPHSDLNRSIGQMVASAPLMGVAGKAAGLVGRGISTGANALADSGYIPASVANGVSDAVNFLGGKVASNAVIDPATGAVTQGASLGNKALQYGATGTNAALQGGGPLTALTSAGSNQSVGEQAKQNAEVGGVLGSAMPAALDVGISAANKLKSIVSKADPYVQKAADVMTRLAGGLPSKLDTNNYLPSMVDEHGNVLTEQTTLAKAAAMAKDPNAGNLAALEQVFRESNVGDPTLFNPAFAAQKANNDKLRNNAILQLTGKPSDIAESVEAKLQQGAERMGDSAARRAYDPNLSTGTVWQNNGKADISETLAAIPRIREEEWSNPDLLKHLDDIETALKDPRATDPKTLYKIVRNKINDVVNRDPMKADAPSQETIANLKEIKSRLYDAISAPNAAPKFDAYRQEYAKLSAEQDRMRALQKLGLVNPEASEGSPGFAPTLNKVTSALKTLEDRVNITSPTNPLRYVTDEDVEALRNVQRSLERDDSVNNLLSRNTSGSPTTPKKEMVDKVKSEFGLNTPEGWRRNLHPEFLGSAAGAWAGSRLAQGVGVPSEIGAAVGSSVGQGIGRTLASPFNKGSSRTQNALVQLMLSPTAGSKVAANSLKGFRSTGEVPQFQNALTSAAPYAGLLYNNSSR